MKKALLCFMFTLPVASAQTWSLSGQVQGWPAGQTATLKVLPGSLQMALMLQSPALSETTINKEGRFTLKMPLTGEKIPGGYFEPFKTNNNCQLNVTPKPATMAGVSFVITNKNGKILDSLDLKTTQGNPQLFAFVYSSAAMQVKGACNTSASTITFDQNYQQGWNLVVVQAGNPGFFKTSLSAPAEAQWVPLRNLIDLK